MKSELGAATVHNLSLSAGPIAIELAETMITGLFRDAERTMVSSVTGNAVSAKSDTLSASALQLEVARVLVTPELYRAEELALRGFECRGQFPKKKATSDPAPDQEKAKRDWSFLDAISGRLALEVDLSYTAAVIGDRSATHTFDLPIESGVFDYTRLEDGLAALEDAAIDLELEGDRLILEKDLPLVPFDNTTLLAWPLETEALALAKKGRARLKDLPNFERKRSATADAKPAKEPKFRLGAVEIRSKGTELSLGGGEVLRIGGITLVSDPDVECRIEGLGIEGTVSYSKGESQETAVRIALKGVSLGLRGSVGERELMMSGLRIPEMSVQVDFQGFVPTTWSMRAAEIGLASVSVSQ